MINKRGYSLAIAMLVAGFGLSPLQAATYTWKPVVIHGGGFVPGLAFSPVQSGLIYARTDVGGFYRGDINTGIWVPLDYMWGGSATDRMGGESIAPDPVDPNVVYVAGGFGNNGTMLRSSDQGASWTAYATTISMGGNNDGRQAGERLAVDPHLTSKLYFASRNQGLWVSTNSAATWTQIAAFPVLGDAGYGLSWVQFDSAGTVGTATPIIYVGVEAMSANNCNVYRSTNAGATWTLIAGGPTKMITTHASLGSDGMLWLVYNSGGYGPGGITTGQIWRLNTSTLAWTNLTPPGGPPATFGGYGGISVDAQNAQHVAVVSMDWWSGNDKAFSTSNGGGTWSTIMSSVTGWNSPPYSLFSNGGNAWVNGCSVPSINSGSMGWPCSIKIDPFNSANAIYGTGGGVWSSSTIMAATKPGGVTWTFNDTGIEETAILYQTPSMAGGIHFSCLGDVAGMRHTNLDVSPAGGVYCNPSFTNTNALDFAQANPNIVVRVGNSGTTTSDIAYSSDNGQTWAPWGKAPAGYTTANNMETVAVAADGSRIIAVPYSGNGSPAYATSLGGNWTTCTGLPSGAWVTADRSTASTFYAASPSIWVFGGTVTIYRSTNGGTSFSSVNSFTVGFPDSNGNGFCIAPRSVFGVPGEFWVSTYDKLYRFTGGGTTMATVANVYEPMGGVGFGISSTGTGHPAVYLSGTVSGVQGIFRCDDGVGTTWTRIDDAQHRFGNPSWLQGDELIYGRVIVSTSGLGQVYGDIGGTPTWTPTATGTATATATRTATKTPTITPSMTPTATPSPTFSTSATFSFTATSSPTGTATPSATITNSFTATFTQTLTRTPTLSFTSTPSFTATPTNVSSQVNSTSGPLEIQQVLMVPNPATENQAWISLQMAGTADGLKWSVYTPAMVKAQQSSMIAPIPVGWASEPIDISGLPNGLFYLVVEATRNGGGVSVRKIARLMILR